VTWATVSPTSRGTEGTGEGEGAGSGGVPAPPLEGGGLPAGCVGSGSGDAVEATVPRFTIAVRAEKTVFVPWTLAARTMKRSVDPMSVSATG
jgi:hypothetical protein